METRLKPCPFCGGAAKFTDLGIEGDFEDWDVECCDCGIIMIAPGEEDGCVTTKEEAAAVWNRRVDERMLVLDVGVKSDDEKPKYSPMNRFANLQRQTGGKKPEFFCDRCHKWHKTGDGFDVLCQMPSYVYGRRRKLCRKCAKKVEGWLIEAFKEVDKALEAV